MLRLAYAESSQQHSWVDQITIPGDPIALALRGLVWCAIATALLVWNFRRLELGN